MTSSSRSQKAAHPNQHIGSGSKPSHISQLYQELPPEPSNYWQLRRHLYEEKFQKAMEDHIKEHREFGSWESVDKERARSHQILHCRWVYQYKWDQQGNLVQCKARLVVRGDQQWENELPTRATTLAIASFRILLAIVAYFDLELEQFDVVNAFVHVPIDEQVFMKQAPGYRDRGEG